MLRIFFILSIFSIVHTAQAQLYIGNFYGTASENINGYFNFEIPLGIPIPIKTFNDKKQKIIFSPRYTLAQTYLNDKWQVTTNGSSTNIALDNNPAHEYKQSIFSHRSKIRTWSWEAWLGFESTFGKVTADLFYAPSFIQTGSFRRKFVEDNEVIKVKDKFKDKADYYNINRFHHRVYASLSIYGIGLGAYANLTPFFKKNLGPVLNRFGITLVIRDSFLDFLGGSGDDNGGGLLNTKPNVKQMKF